MFSGCIFDVMSVINKYCDCTHMEVVCTSQVRHHTCLILCTCCDCCPKNMMIVFQHSLRRWYGGPNL